MSLTSSRILSLHKEWFDTYRYEEVKDPQSLSSNQEFSDILYLYTQSGYEDDLLNHYKLMNVLNRLVANESKSQAETMHDRLTTSAKQMGTEVIA